MKNRKRWIYLFVGAVFLVFANGRFAYAFAAWLAPALLLSFTRKEKAAWGAVIFVVVSGVCTQISFFGGSFRNPWNILFYLPFFMGLVLPTPYFTDRLLRKHFTGATQTLIFPTAYTTIEFLYVSISPLGSTGSLAYSQTEFTSFVQIASVTGIYGITFMITWFSSVAADLCESGNTQQIKKHCSSI